jgi:nitrate/nitrite transporter NarK
MDQTFLSDMGSVSSIFNGFGRITWGIVGDRIGLTRALAILAFLISIIIGKMLNSAKF